MKHARKALALMLAMFVSLVIAAPAFADDTKDVAGTGTAINKIIVDNAEAGSHYSLIQVFEGHADAANQQQANPYKPMSYTLTDAQKKMITTGDSTFNQDVADYFNQYFEIVNDYNVKVKDETVFKTAIDSEAGNAAFAEFAAAFGTVKVASFEASGGTITFENVPYGYYVVTTDTTDPAIVTIDSSTPVETHVIDKNVKTDIKKEITDQDINGGTISSDKHANSAALDEGIEFTITGDAKNYEGTDKVFAYFIEDTMDKEFSLVTVPTVKVGSKDLQEGKDFIFTSGGAAGDDGFVIYIPWTDDANLTDPQNIIDSTKAGKHLYGATDKIVVTYTAKLDPAKVPANYKPSNENTAKIKNLKGDDTPSHVPPTGTNWPEDKTKTYSTGIDITKTDDATTPNPLQGAEFTLTRKDGGDLVAAIKETTSSTTTYVAWVDDGNGGPTKYWAASTASGYTDEDPTTPIDGLSWTDATTWATYSADATDPGYVADPAAPTAAELAYAKGKADNYKYTLGSYTGWADGTDPATLPVFMEQTSGSASTTYVAKGTGQSVTSITATTDANGKAYFEGLAPGTYVITETKVPDGYIKTADHEYEVTFDSTSKQFTWKMVKPTAATSGTLVDIDKDFEDTIVDPIGTEFPETGGMGTRILYTVGGLMVAGAAIYLITKKRMASEA